MPLELFLGRLVRHSFDRDGTRVRELALLDLLLRPTGGGLIGVRLSTSGASGTYGFWACLVKLSTALMRTLSRFLPPAALTLKYAM